MSRGISLIIFLVILVIYLMIYDSNHDDDIEYVEEQVLKTLYQERIVSKWIQIQVGEERWNTHYIQSKELNQTKENVILLHGYGATSALTWRVTLPGLVDNFNVSKAHFYSCF